MAKRFFQLAVAVITFGLGLGAFQMGRYLNRPMPYCSVATNGDVFHHSLIRVKARVFINANGIHVYEDCDPVEALAASLELPLTGVTGRQDYLDQAIVTGETDLKTADAIIEGLFDGHASTGCWSPKFRITATKVELISTPTDYAPPPSENSGLRTKH
jgi:hypothetical protein